MYTNLCPEASKDEGVSDFNNQSPSEKVSVQAQLPSKFYNEKLATPRLRCAVFVDEARVLRYRKPSGRARIDYCTIENEVFVSALSSGSYQKPWPSRKGAGVEELVKYMSSIPCYLQQIEKGENVQEKALNFGVIDWRRLEKWRNSQKDDQMNEVSPSINKTLSPSLMKDQSCSYSCRNSNNNHAQRIKASSLGTNHVHSVVEKPKFMSDPPNSRTSPRRSPWSNHENCSKFKHDHRTSMQNEAGNSTEVKSNHCEKHNYTPDSRNERIFMEHGRVSDPQNSSKQGSISGEIPLSGLVSAMFQKDEFDMGAKQGTNGFTSSKLSTTNSINNSTNNLMVSTDAETGNEKVEAEGNRVGKKQLIKHPSVAGLKWLSRTSSLKDMMSTSHELKDVNGLDISDNKGRSNSRGRQSPLRRLLDPLLKPKNDSNSRPPAKTPIHHSQEQLNTMNMSDNIGPSNHEAILTSHGLLKDENYDVPMRQALVKLTWKNAQPLFMFSTNDNNILVASLRRTGKLGKEDSGAVYTIVAAQEPKKKGVIWTSQSKNRKPSLLYDVVGHVKVSCAKLSSFDSKGLEISRQFVLIGDKLVVPCKEFMNSADNTELAAIVVKAPYQKSKGSVYNTHVEDLEVEKYPESSRMCGVTVIIPNGVHGFSDTGKPSTVIERWKSGGSCDCEGWDEGCRLTVLADRLPEMKIASSVPKRHIELFFQGKKGGNQYAFSMITFKEGLYTVEFGSSITLLQAFAICIATLHNTSIDSIQRNGGLITGYEPHHPPFSPVGRS